MRTRLLLVILLAITIHTRGQDLLSQLQQESPKEKEYTYQTFKGTRIVNGHSVETKGKGELEFIISHRFGRLNSGSYNFWGLDGASIRIGLEYGLNDRLAVGLGRSSYFKIYDGYLKYRLIKQGTGPGSMPLSVTGLASATIKSDTSFTHSKAFSDKLGYTAQLLIARKFSSRFSLQIMPTFVHSNMVNDFTHPANEAAAPINLDQFALGAGGRFKITKSIAINAEYYARVNEPSDKRFYNSIGLGVDIETGGHVFQLIFSNTPGMIERTFINQSNGNFFKGDINFGFNISRTFQLKKERSAK